jgi:hypothetical protein
MPEFTSLSQDTSDELKCNREHVLSAVNWNGIALQYAPTALQANREIILAAVQKNGDMLYGEFNSYLSACFF